MEGWQTERLTFRRINAADAPFMLALMNEPGYLANIGDRGVRTLDAAAAFIRDSLTYSEDGLGFHKLLLSETAEPIGIAGVVKRDFLELPDLGYALLAQHEGHGYATEAARAALAFGHEVLGAARLGAIVSPGNDASISILEKLGMRFVSKVAYPGEEAPVHLYKTE